ncbi:MAG TPA: zinc ribbon domain-containing protein [Thermoplasmata archaeon]|nr:zinc ribbon domain-containing protein [Thermoplasmata archaeon]
MAAPDPSTLPPPPPPPPPAPAGGPITCPKCGSTATPGSRFCNICGSSLFTEGGSSTGTMAPAGSPPIDIRQKVDQDRGPLKRLQLLIPGYRGYREGEDIRAADSFLRIQVADKIKNARTTIENSRSSLSNAAQFQALNDLAPVIADLLRFEGEVRFAEGGFTGFSPAVRINPQQLDRLYEYDYGFVQAADQLNQTTAQLPSIATGSNPAEVAALVTTVRGQVSQLEQAFKARIQVIEGIRVSS